MAREEEELSKGNALKWSPDVIFVSVGTFVHGFNELVSAADRAARDLHLHGFAQIGESSVLPETLHWARFLDRRQMAERLRTASLVVCHGGVGILGEAMRARKAIVVVPRQGATNANNPANDQTAFAEKICATYGTLRADPETLTQVIKQAIAQSTNEIDYPLNSNIPEIIADFLDC